MPTANPNRATRRATPAKRVASKRAVATSEEPTEVPLWDEFVTEASPDVIAWQKRLPDGTVLVVDCPSSEQLDEVSDAMMVGDTSRILDALFGEDADKVMGLTAKLPFVVRLKLVNDVLEHYGMSQAALPESSASLS